MTAAKGDGRLASGWVDRSIRSKSLVVIVVPLVILVLVLGAMFWFTHVNSDAQDTGGHARQTMTAAINLQSTVLGAENAVRGYLLTGDGSFLTTYDTARTEVPGAVSQLHDLATGGATERRLVADSATQALAVMADLVPVLHGRAGSAPAAAALAKSRDDTVGLNGAVASLQRLEGGVIATEHSTIHTSGILLLGIVAGAVVLALAGGVAASQLFTSGVVTRLRRLERATEAIEAGQVPLDVPGGADEIGRLAVLVMGTASQLRLRAEERDRARAELEHLLTASPVVSLRYDVGARRFSYASPNIERFLGITAAQAMADFDSVNDRFHPEDRDTLRRALTGAIGSSGRVDVLLRFRRHVGDEQWGEAEASYTLDVAEDGNLRSVVAYLVDVSEWHVAQRAADERRFMLESIFHASPDTIVVRDEQGRVVLASSTLAEVVANQSGQADGGNGGAGAPGPDELIEAAYRFGNIGAAERASLQRLLDRCTAGDLRPEPVITTGHRVDGQTRTFETRARPVLDEMGRVTGTVTVSRDITERVRLEQSLRQASTGAERASAAKSEFLSRMSHELRTPLNAVLGFAQLLALDELPEEQASSVDQIEKAGRHLLSLINEVLDISRIESGQITLSTEPVPVNDVLGEVATLLSPVAEASGVALVVEAGSARDSFVRADRQRLLQVLLNLGSNAVKYNARGGSVAFRTNAADNGCIRFEVHDTGPGIPHDQQDRLFVPFSRLGAERSAVEGTGVGLALSKQLVEVMGGDIGVESAPGRGSTFWVELAAVSGPTVDAGSDASAAAGPDAPALAGTTAPAPTTTGAGGDMDVALHAGGNGVPDGRERPVLVLHIEDNASNATLVRQILARRPVRLVAAAEAHTGLELARQHRPDLILLDLHLPDLSGDELLYRLKALPELADTKVIVVSADATPSTVRRMLELGVEGYLTKPVDVEALLRLVDREIGAGSAAGRPQNHPHGRAGGHNA